MSDRDAERKVTETSSSLLARANANDPQAWSTLVSLYAPLIYGWCRRWGVSPQAATDIGKSVLEHVFRKLNSHQQLQLQESFRGWLFELTRRQYLVHVHESNAEAAQNVDQNGNTALFFESDFDEQELDREQQILYQSAFNIVEKMFSPDEWKAFIELYLKKKSVNEISEELGWSVETVCITKSKILRRLRQEFENLLDF